MMHLARVNQSGAILLADCVVCDGFDPSFKVRVQTHIHQDHMVGFDQSKSRHDIVMSTGTHRLLLAELAADLPHRENVIAVDYEQPFSVPGGTARLVSARHMLGAAQVEVLTAEGVSLGYSGDFNWPLDRAIQVQELVVDATNGSPRCVREYSQEDAETALCDFVAMALRQGSVCVLAHRGVTHRALEIMTTTFRVPFVGSTRLIREVDAYRKSGSVIGDVLCRGTSDAESALRDGRYVQILGLGDRRHVDPDCVQITLSAFRHRGPNPVLQFSNSAYSIGFSDHADYEGTIQYVAATGARRVITDSTRGFAVELALGLRERLGIIATPSETLNESASSISFGLT